MNIAPQISVAGDQAEDELWYKDAIVYQLHVKAFADSNNDGIGDFAGLTEKLDYLQDLGVTALWLLPFYPSPGRDDGYDIADYRRINPDFGTMKDFRRFIQECKRRNLRVITELVVNHTSDQHPWFKRARRSRRGTDARNWYVWSDNDQKYAGTRIIFTDTEKSNWTFDSVAGSYFWHRFFSHQPDLNFDNPRVLWAVVQVMRRWLDMGVDGFRLDAIPYLCEREGTNNENLPETHAIIKQIRAELDAYASGKLLLAEANQWPEDVSAYFGDGDECHMAYHFPVMPRIYMAIAQEDRFPIADIMRQTPDIPANCQWALFLRNHDELTLEMVTDSERDYLWSTYASDPRARINLGIRRRLAPLMDNDRRKIELMNALLLSLPGTPILYYGDEIGMGDNIYLGDRNGVRTPMQWSPDRNAGFSRCDPAKLYLPVIMDPIYGYESVNVEAQQRSVSSLLSWTKRMISVRKSSRVFGRGTLSFIRPANRAVLVFVRQYESETILCVFNMSRSAQAAEIDLTPWRGWVPVELLGRTRFPRVGEGHYVITLPPYGFFWFYLMEQEGGETETTAVPPEFVTLVLSASASSLFDHWNKRAFERDVLPSFLASRRWFADKDVALRSATLQATVPVQTTEPAYYLALVDTETERGESRYLLPLTIEWKRIDKTAHPPAAVVAAVRRGPREGTLVDAATETEFVTLLLAKLHIGASVEAQGGTIAFRPTAVFQAMPTPTVEQAQPVNREQSNTTVIADANYVVKLFRRIKPGIHPEAEMGRFLTDVAGYANTPALLGSIELANEAGNSALAVVHAFVENQGDAWAVTNAYLDRFIDNQRLITAETASEDSELIAYLHRMHMIGRRTAELHLALACRDDVPEFAPESVTPEDIAGWTLLVLERARRTFDALRHRTDLSEANRELAAQLLADPDSIMTEIEGLLPSGLDFAKIRHHGDFHLGQMLIARDDVMIIDFEGEPQRSVEERRCKACAARDVAGLLRSIDYSTTAALDRMVQPSPEELARLHPALDVWRDAATEAFLSAYREFLTDQRLWPRELADADRLLRFFLLEKALYEIEYELANRPNWLNVPLAGTLRILRPPANDAWTVNATTST